jgi:hypothetical protein
MVDTLATAFHGAWGNAGIAAITPTKPLRSPKQSAS